MKTMIWGVLGLLWLAACSSSGSTTRSASDGGACGQAPVGTTCKKAAGGCEAQICVGAQWTCAEGESVVALTPENCAASDAGTSDGGEPCGPRPVGGTCKKPSGGCEPQVCAAGIWKCPDGDVETPVVPGACDAIDGGGD